MVIARAREAEVTRNSVGAVEEAESEIDNVVLYVVSIKLEASVV